MSSRRNALAVDPGRPVQKFPPAMEASDLRGSAIRRTRKPAASVVEHTHGRVARTRERNPELHPLALCHKQPLGVVLLPAPSHMPLRTPVQAQIGLAPT